MTLRAETLAGGVRRLTLDRPAAANALDRAMQTALVAELDAAARDPATRALLLAGAGGRVFSAGADLREDLGPDGRRLRREMLVRTLLALLDCPKPVVAMLRGKAVGGGAMLALLADEVVMETGATLSLPEIALGMPTPLGVAIVTARGGRAAAHRLVQANRPMGAEAALAGGLAETMADDATLEGAALARAAALGSVDPRAYACNKRFLNAPLRRALLEAAEAAAAFAAETADAP